jgi:hypothetical protein
MTSPDGGGEHVNDLELAAYLDRGLSVPDRARVESHLAVCTECRSHVASAKLLIDRAGRPRWALRVGVPAAVAAAVAAFLLISPWDAQIKSNGNGRTRAGAEPNGLIAYNPVGNVTRSGLRFIWSSATANASYRVTVSDDSGNTVWSVSGADTSVAIPDSVRLAGTAHYYWVVDALAADGRTLSTGLREFGVGP